MVSVESCLKYLESDADVVKTVTSSGVEEAWEELSTSNPDRLVDVIIPVGIELFVLDNIPT